MDLRGIRFSAEAISEDFVANKKRYSCWLFLILWVQTITLLASLNLPIDVVSDGLHSQKQCIIIPRRRGSSAGKGIIF
jgi:hypothetical protein